MKSLRFRPNRGRRSRDSLLLLAVVVATSAITSPIAPASARGGGPANIINSEGYQRALREERKQYQAAQPVVAPTATPRHRRHRHH